MIWQFMTEEDLKVAEAMEKYGGSFVKALAAAIYVADDDNLCRIKATWPHYWGHYKRMADTVEKDP